MLVLTVRTDKPESEIGLFDDDTQLAYVTWQAHRELSDTIHHKIDELLKSQQKSLDNLEGLVAYLGPGSFTGLRIGLSVANALSDSLQLPIVGAQTDTWITKGLKRLQNGDNDHILLPEYGAPVHITQQKH